MKNLVRFILILVLTVVIGFSMATCTGSTKSVDTSTGKIVNTTTDAAQFEEPGTLTITGLDAYEGYNIIAKGYAGGDVNYDNVLVYAVLDVESWLHQQGFKLTGGVIKNGSVTLPLWSLSLEKSGVDREGEDVYSVQKMPYTGNASDVYKLNNVLVLNFTISIWKADSTSIYSELIYQYDPKNISSLPVFFFNKHPKFEIKGAF